MEYTKPSHNLTRFSLCFLLTLLALNAFAGGYYGMAGAKGVPVVWLTGSPFNNYFIPGLILFVFVGGSAMIAALALFLDFPRAREMAFLSAGMVFIWLIVQVAIIGYVSWMQPTTGAIAFIILFLTWKLPRYGY